jgi:hypothetical protein
MTAFTNVITWIYELYFFGISRSSQSRDCRPAVGLLPGVHVLSTDNFRIYCGFNTAVLSIKCFGVIATFNSHTVATITPYCMAPLGHDVLTSPD